MDEKYTGLIYAMASSLLIGVSFIITKISLIESAKRLGGPVGDNYVYLQNWRWWLGMITMVLGETSNFAAYSFAPAILVTPLGAGSVLISTVLAHFFLDERLTTQNLVGCTLCIIGSIIIILHSPEEHTVNSTNEILEFALKPGFLFYVITATGISLYFIYKVGPIYGRQNMLVYITICSLLGSISVMAVKGFAIALKLTFSGNNQLFNFSTYLFGATVIVCAVTQMNYFNKALEIFSTNRVTPVYYVFFTSATIVASIILFNGIQNSTAVDIATMFCGFVTIFIGVFQLTDHKKEEGLLHKTTPRRSRQGEGLGDGVLLKTLRLNEGGKYNRLEEDHQDV